MALGKWDKGYEVAKDAMTLFIKRGNKLPWIILEQIDLIDIRVDAHFSREPHEGQLPETGIIHPLSFQIWWKGEDKQDSGELLETIYFEIGIIEGKPSTAALGQWGEKGHRTFGSMKTASTYSQIRERLVTLTTERHKSNNKEIVKK